LQPSDACLYYDTTSINHYLKKFFLQEDGCAIAQQRKHNCGTTMQQSVRIRDTKKEEKNREDARLEKQNEESVGE
jgi:hypothetical protein